MLKISTLWAKYGAIAIVTFEVFWIVIFLLDAAASATGAEITGFVYANF